MSVSLRDLLVLLINTGHINFAEHVTRSFSYQCRCYTAFVGKVCHILYVSRKVWQQGSVFVMLVSENVICRLIKMAQFSPWKENDVTQSEWFCEVPRYYYCLQQSPKLQRRIFLNSYSVSFTLLSWKKHFLEVDYLFQRGKKLQAFNYSCLQLLTSPSKMFFMTQLLTFILLFKMNDCLNIILKTMVK